MSSNESNIIDDDNILKYFQSFEQDNYSAANKVIQRTLKSRSIDKLKYNLTQKYKPKCFNSPEDLGISGHFIDVDFNKTNDYLREMGNFGKAPKIIDSKNQMLFNRKIQNYKPNDEQARLTQKEYIEIKEKKIMYIRSLAKQKLSSDPGLYHPNYDAVYRRPVFPIIRRAKYASDISAIPEPNIIQCSRSRNKNNNSSSNNNKAASQHKKLEPRLKKSETNYRLYKQNQNIQKDNSSGQTERKLGNRSSLFSLYKMNARKTQFNKPTSALYFDNKKKTSTVNFQKMTGRHDEDNFYFKHNLVPSVSYTPNYLFNASHVKTVHFSRVKSLSDIKRSKISKFLHSYSVDKDYSIFRLNKERSRSRIQKKERS